MRFLIFFPMKCWGFFGFFSQHSIAGNEIVTVNRGLLGVLLVSFSKMCFKAQWDKRLKTNILVSKMSISIF